ncbi:MAG: hypothetical protein ACREBG_19495, partial [Pyrinomonadaceae bacterium]
MTATVARRKFLRTLTGAALAGVISPTSQISAATTTHGELGSLPKTFVFWETSFPSIDGCAVTHEVLQNALQPFAVSFLSERDLVERLNS